MLKGTILIGKVNLLYDRIVRITPTPLDEVFSFQIFISMEDNQRIYLDKVVEFLVRDTRIDYGEQIIYYPFSFFSLFSLPLTPLTSLPLPTKFSNYCRNTYGLTDEEIDYVWNEYVNIIINKIKNGE